MPEVVYYVAASLDGYLAPVDGSLDWLMPFEGTDEDHGYAEFYASVDAVLVGSRTYEQMIGFGDWPYVGTPTWVFSSRDLEADRPDVTITDSSPAAVLKQLDVRGVRRAWLVGGGALAGAFESAGLITEYIVSVIPVLLGAGIPLFGGPVPLRNLHLEGTTRYSDGIVQLRYLPAGG